MDARFTRVWDEVRDRRARGEGLPEILQRLGMEDLVALLAAVPKSEPVMANAIATALLNRVRRLHAMTWLLVGLTLGVALYLIDGIYTGEWLDIEGGPIASGIAVLSLVIIVAALFALFLIQRDQLRGRSTNF